MIRRRDEDGQASIELLGLTPIVLMVALAVIQALLFGHAAIATEQAARTAARVGMSADDPFTVRAAARSALPTRLRDEATTTFPDGSLSSVRVETRVPTVVPADWLPEFTITRSVTMPEVATWD